MWISPQTSNTGLKFCPNRALSQTVWNSPVCAVSGSLSRPTPQLLLLSVSSEEESTKIHELEFSRGWTSLPGPQALCNSIYHMQSLASKIQEYPLCPLTPLSHLMWTCTRKLLQISIPMLSPKGSEEVFFGTSHSHACKASL